MSRNLRLMFAFHVCIIWSYFLIFLRCNAFRFLCDFVLSDMDDFKVAAKKAEQAGFIWNSEKLQSYMVLIKVSRVPK